MSNIRTNIFKMRYLITIAIGLSWLTAGSQIFANRQDVIYFEADQMSTYDRLSLDYIGVKSLTYCDDYAGLSLIKTNSPNCKIFQKRYDFYRYNYDSGQLYVLNGDCWQHVTTGNAKNYINSGEYFVYHETLYRYGPTLNSLGQNIFTLLDTNTGIWSVLDSQVFHSEISGLIDFRVMVSGDQLYLYDGFLSQSTSATLEPFKSLWRFSFQDKSWHEIADVDISVLNSLHLVGTHGSYIYGYDSVELQEVRLNFALNEKYTLPLTQVSLEAFKKCASYTAEDGSFIYSICPDRKLIKHQIDEKLFLLQGEKTKIAISHWDLIIPVGFLLVLLIMAYLWITQVSSIKNSYKKGRVYFNNNVLYFQDRSVALSQNESDVLYHLIVNNHIDTNTIGDIIDINNVSISHAHKLKSDVIKAINTHLYDVIGINNVIVRLKNRDDKRMNSFVIDLKYAHLFSVDDFEKDEIASKKTDI